MTQNLYEGTSRRATRTADGHLAGPLAHAILGQGAAATVIEPGAGARVLPAADSRASAIELRAAPAGGDSGASRKSYIISGVLVVIAIAVWLWPAPAPAPAPPPASTAEQSPAGGEQAVGEAVSSDGLSPDAGSTASTAKVAVQRRHRSTSRARALQRARQQRTTHVTVPRPALPKAGGRGGRAQHSSQVASTSRPARPAATAPAPTPSSAISLTPVR